ncbi:MAG TPA: glycosyltransferase [Acetobacteraceae bacterium]
MQAHVLYIGGEDHNLRIPAMVALRDQGFRITAAGTGDPGPFRDAGLPFEPYRLERFVAPLADWNTCKELALLMRRLAPDVVQSFDSKLGILVPIAARRVPGPAVIRTINGRGWVFSSRAPLALALRPIYRTLHRIGARSTTATVFEIREDQAFFTDNRLLGPSRSVLVAGAGVDVQGFDAAFAGAAPSAQLRQQLGLGDAPVVITVTRMTRQKGIPTLLQAAALVHRQRPDVRFVLVGPRESEGPVAVSAAEIARHAPYVIATGPRADVPALLRMATMFAFPTEYREGVPRVLLEAALAGLPTVTTGIGGCSDVIRHGWSGLVAPLRDPAATAELILQMLANPDQARAMAERAAALVRQEFSLERVVASQAALYRELLASGMPPAADRVEAELVPLSATE